MFVSIVLAGNPFVTLMRKPPQINFVQELRYGSTSKPGRGHRKEEAIITARTALLFLFV